MTPTLAEIGAVPLAEVAEGPADAARGVPIYQQGGTVRAFAMVDALDYEWLATRRWYMAPNGYVIRNLSPTEGRGQISMHREVMGLGRGDPEHVDHRNHDKLNNTRRNLRYCTHQQNHENRRPDRGSVSRFRGVSYYSGCPEKNLKKRWIVQVQHCGKKHHLGYFATEQDAADAAAAFRRQRMPFATE